MVAILGMTKDQIFEAVREMYSAVATDPSRQFHFPTGRDACLFVGYPEQLIDALPPTAVESFAGVGFPFRAGIVGPGDRVLDIGSGSGTDTLIAASLVGAEGRVYGLDMTGAMLNKLRRNALIAKAENVEAIEGNAEAIPLPDASVDVACLSGVLHEAADPQAVVREVHRVLRPGGKVLAVVPAKYSIDWWRPGAGPVWSGSPLRSKTACPPITRFSARRLRKLFSGFEVRRIHKRQLSRREIPLLLRAIPRAWLERLLGKCLILKAFKPIGSAVPQLSSRKRAAA